MISVVIPLYNKQGMVARTLRSVLAQTFRDFEVVIVDDGSTDGSVEEARSVHDGRIHIVSQQNAGVSAARNRGISEARYDLIAFLDADDEWHPTYLETQYNLYKKYPDCAVFACNYEFRDAGSEKVIMPRLNMGKLAGVCGVLDDYFDVASTSDPPLWTSAVMVRKDMMQSVGCFPVGVKSGEDLLTWARIACRGGIAYCRKPLAIYRRGYSNPRPPEPKDYVGKQLEVLLHENPHKVGLWRYVAFWYKMRMCRCLANKMWTAALRAFGKSLRYNLLQTKIYASAIKYTIMALK